MSDFKREERYIVIKRKNLDALEEGAIRRLLADSSIPTVECVVVEHDWPNYEDTWEAIEQVVEGAYVPGGITTLRQQLEQAQAKAENCEREARQWRQEARTQSATVAEIYQELTGRTGEPGNWNGARPLKPAILRKQAEAITKASNEAHNKLFEQAMLSRDSGEAISAFMDYAQRLRQQADEAEKDAQK